MEHQGQIMTQRNRAEGWEHAKRSGHQREIDLAAELRSDSEFSSWFHEEIFGTSESIAPMVATSGASMDRVPSVLGDLTIPKIDFEVVWPRSSESRAKVSLKKSETGQVWLVTRDRFIRGFEAQFGRSVSDAVVEGLRLFIGPLEESEMVQALAGRPLLGGMSRSGGLPQEMHQRRFVAATLDAYFRDIWRETLGWFRSEAHRIADLCFRRGLAAQPEHYASGLLYSINDPSSGTVGNHYFALTELVDRIQSLAPDFRAVVGPRFGGSTVLLPFGFLQMHNPRPRGQASWNNQLQFHHQLKQIQALFSEG